MYYIPLHNPVTNAFWRIKRDPVYRLVDQQQWLDNFFSKGEIMLSCFSKFRANPDEFQGDAREGDGFAYFEYENGDTVGIQYHAGVDAYILCTTNECNDKTVRDFNAVGAIKIWDTIGFAYEIAQCIKNFTSGLEGNCIYDDTRVFRLKNDKRLSELYKNKDAINHLEFMQEFRLLTSDREIFLKHTKYKYQQEYRLVWYVNNPIDQGLLIKCPALIEMCERIDF